MTPVGCSTTPALRHALRPGSRAQDLWLVRVVQRSGRQRLVSPRGDDAPSGAVTNTES